MNYISQNVRCLRKKKNLSIRGLSKLSGVPHAVIDRIEKELTSNPSIEKIMKLHTALDIDMDDFIYRDMCKTDSMPFSMRSYEILKDISKNFTSYLTVSDSGNKEISKCIVKFSSHRHDV